MMNDQLADMLARIKNAWMRRSNTLTVKNTKLVWNSLKVLENKGCIGEVSQEGDKIGIKLTYSSQGYPWFDKLTRVSKGSVRRYVDVESMKKLGARFKQNLYVVSTNQGLLALQDAIAANVGGELLFKAC